MNNTILQNENGDFIVCETEKCVLCGTQTNIPVSLPIDLRNNYVEGAGQLCDRCAVPKFSN
jgi:hypothetical protein